MGSCRPRESTHRSLQGPASRRVRGLGRALPGGEGRLQDAACTRDGPPRCHRLDSKRTLGGPADHRGGPDNRRSPLSNARGSAPGILSDAARRVLLRAKRPCAVDQAQPRLRAQPLTRAGQLSLCRNVVKRLRKVRQGPAPPADAHPPVRLRSVVLIQQGAYARCFGCDHDSPIARHTQLGPRRAGRTATCTR